MEKQDINSIYRCFRWLANAVVIDYQKSNLTDNMRMKTLRFFESVSRTIDWDKLTRDDFLALGFMNWSDIDDEYELWVFPAWMYPIIPDGMEIFNANLEQMRFSRNLIPFKERFGCLDYGLRIKNNSKDKTIEELLKEDVEFE